jgi:DNA-binding NarL/FixJ family response regulator
MTIRILLVDDQALVRAGFRLILEAQRDLTVVGEAADGSQAVEMCRALHPDVVLMDVRMPQMNGIEATRALQQVQRPPTVLVLTTFDLDEYVFDALEAGASGFLLKDVTREDLVRAVRVVAAGEALLAPSVTRRLIAEFGVLRRSAAPIPIAGLNSLTAREREVLAHMARGLSNAEIAAALVVSEHTVKTHVASILAKLQVRDRVQAVIVAYRGGLAPASAG